MKQYWWIWTFLAGIALSVAVALRVGDRYHEIERSQIERSIEAINKQTKDKPNKEQGDLHLRLADKLKNKLEQEDLHPENLAAYRYWEGWNRFQAGLTYLQVALGGDGEPGDPRPASYTQAWKILEQAVKSSHLDLPDPEKHDYERFLALAQEELLSNKESFSEVRDYFRLETEKKDGKDLLLKADGSRLKRVGVQFFPASTSKQSTKEKGEWYDLHAGKPITAPQREFLANRLAVLQKLEDCVEKLTDRFYELKKPEYAWHFHQILFQDYNLGVFTLQNLLDRVLDSRLRHFQAFTEFAGRTQELASGQDSPKPGESVESMRSSLEKERKAYQASLEYYTRELYQAVAELPLALKRLETEGKRYKRQEQSLVARMKGLENFDPELYRATIAEHIEDPERIKALIKMRSSEVKEELEALRSEKEYSYQRIFDAFEAINAFRKHLADLGNEQKLRQRFLSLEELQKMLLGAGELASLIEKPLEAFGQESSKFQNYVTALRNVMLIDLRILRTRLARHLGDQDEIKGLYQNPFAPSVQDPESFEGYAQNLGSVREDFSLLQSVAQEIFSYQPSTEASPPGDGLEVDPLEARGPLYLVDSLIRRYEELSVVTMDSAREERLYYLELGHELRSLRRSLLGTYYEYAEFQYQLVLGQLEKLTGPNRPFVPALEAFEFSETDRNWVRRVMKARSQGQKIPARPLPDMDSYPNVYEFMEQELLYRNLRDQALETFRELLSVQDDSVRRRARFAISSILLDDIMYNYDWKWRNAFQVQPENDYGFERYGVFAFVEDIPYGFDGLPRAEQGRWLDESEALQRYFHGPDAALIDEVDAHLTELRKLTPSQDLELYVATWIRSGQLKEFRAAHSPEEKYPPSNIERYYPGDFPGAIQEYYLPLLQDLERVSDQALIQNTFIPLAIHFDRVNSKLQRMLRDIDLEDIDQQGNTGLSALFQALMPRGGTNQEFQLSLISDFYEAYYEAVALRAPGLIELEDALYDFNYQLGELAQINQDLLLEKARSDNTFAKRKAQEMRELSYSFFRRAGQRMQDWVARFPHSPGATHRMIKIGDAFFRSEDYVFAIAAYQKYFEERRLVDQRSEQAQLPYVANKIGEAFLELGIYEGKTLQAARASKDQKALQEQMRAVSIKLDGALPAFEWCIQRTRGILNQTGDGGQVGNRLSPVGSLEAFINMAHTKFKLGRNLIRQGQEEQGIAILQEGIQLVSEDIIKGRIFPRPVEGFSQSLLWRDAQYYRGLSELELARLATEGSEDSAILLNHLDAAYRAFDDVIQRWPDPVNRNLYQYLMRNKGKRFEEALEESEGRSGIFKDDVYYLALFHISEVEWLRAVYNPEPLSASVVEVLQGVQPRLEFLKDRLGKVNTKEQRLESTVFTFPDLDRQTRYLLGDVVYLRARTLKDRMEQGDTPEPFEIRRLYRDAIEIYEDARKIYPQTYLAAQAYAQTINCRRALGQWDPDQKRQALQMLEASGTFLESLNDQAFSLAPEGMKRQDYEDLFQWYQNMFSQ